MAGYELSDRFSTAGNGTVLLPELYLPVVENEIPLFANFWAGYTAQNIQGFEIFGPGQGMYWHMALVEDVTPTSTALSSGTAITTTDGTNLSQISGTISEYGGGEYIEQFQNWLSNVDTQAVSGAQWFRHAMLSRNKIIGDTYMGCTQYFFKDDNGDFNYNIGSGGSSTYLAPADVRAARSKLLRLGIPTFDDGLYRWVGPPGAFDGLKAQSEVYSSAASLGLGDLYTSGEVMKFGGFAFVEEVGPNTSTSYATNSTAGTALGESVIIGKNAVAGGDSFDSSELVRYYPDTGDDFGRRGKVGWLAYAGYKIVADGTANARAIKVYSQHS